MNKFIINQQELCNGCHACSIICPEKCITMEQDREGFLYPEIDEEKCTECGLCRHVCPINKSEGERTGEITNPEAFAVINKNEEIRINSSSGGIFSLLAERIINEGGVVFGARFNEKWEVIHDYTETLEGLEAFRGSKYAQSRIGNTFRQVKDFLTEEGGRKVLFSGTPCQIGGLKSYLHKDYDNLFCVDIICYGVPSPKVWQKYIMFREGVAKCKTENIVFRHKVSGWKHYSIMFAFTNKIKYCEIHQKDLFMSGFSKKLYLRPSCYQCDFKTINRISDITIADFWGIQNVAPEMFDDKGTSLVLIQSLKGKHFFDKIKSDTNFAEVDCEKSLQFNPLALRSAIKPKNREKFMKNIDNFPFDKLIKSYTKVSFFKKRPSLVRWTLGKIKRILLNGNKK